MVLSGRTSYGKLSLIRENRERTGNCPSHSSRLQPSRWWLAQGGIRTPSSVAEKKPRLMLADMRCQAGNDSNRRSPQSQVAALLLSLHRRAAIVQATD